MERSRLEDAVIAAWMVGWVRDRMLKGAGPPDPEEYDAEYEEAETVAQLTVEASTRVAKARE